MLTPLSFCVPLKNTNDYALGDLGIPAFRQFEFDYEFTFLESDVTTPLKPTRILEYGLGEYPTMSRVLAL